MDRDFALNKNALVQYLKKPMTAFTREDIIRYVCENNIEMINFMYPAADGRLKTLNFIINDLKYLETLLTLGERVDGSSLFPFIAASSSDLYVLPRFSTAFCDPFAPLPTVTMLCSFFDKDGQPLKSSPEYTLRKACRQLKNDTGLVFQCMGELEYYVIKQDDGSFKATDQRNYHESAPFAKFNDLRIECMHHIAATGGQIKYGHSEVGNFTMNGVVYEQNEIEFLPVDAVDAADQLMLAKWVIRNVAWKNGYDVTFAPKITTGKAGSGLHIHMRLLDAGGKNMMTGADSNLSDTARRAISGLMKLARAITAFGNTNPTSYFRLVPHQEAPTNVCWGDRNRSVLVRVPLGWTTDKDMCAELNAGTTPLALDKTQKQTVEIRSADGTADIYLLMASLAVALREGLTQKDGLEIADKTYVDVNIHNSENSHILDSLETLPINCGQSAQCLAQMREVFEKYGVFDPSIIDSQIKLLQSYDQQSADQAMKDTVKMQALVDRYFHCG